MPVTKIKRLIKKVGITILSLLLVLFVFIKIKMANQPATKIPLQSLSLGFVEISKQIHEVFTQGDQDDLLIKNPKLCESEIGDVAGVGKFYTRCNPGFLQCLYLQKSSPLHNLKFERENSKLKFELVPYENNKIYKVISRQISSGSFLPTYGIELKLKATNYPKFSMKFILEDSCHNTFLPQRKYAYGKENKKEILEWDNFDQNIFVDKFLVSNREIKEFNETLSRDFIFDPKNLSYPATKLSFKQMKEYCAFRSKELLMAHIYDAASFLPTDLEDVEPIKVKRGPLYWTKDIKTSFLKDRNKVQVNQDICNLIYSKDCLKNYNYDPYFTNSSWMGINNSLGGPLEAFYNPIEPDKNLKLSSIYFSFKSNRHAIAERGFWDGENHSPDSIRKEEFEDLKEIQELKIGFRCMEKTPFIVKQDEETHE